MAADSGKTFFTLSARVSTRARISVPGDTTEGRGHAMSIVATGFRTTSVHSQRLIREERFPPHRVTT